MNRKKSVDRWQLQEAKARLSELVKKATSEGPQEITVHGQSAVVVLSRADYDRLQTTRAPEGLADFLLNSPLAGADIEIERDRTPTRTDSLFDGEK